MDARSGVALAIVFFQTILASIHPLKKTMFPRCNAFSSSKRVRRFGRGAKPGAIAAGHIMPVQQRHRFQLFTALQPPEHIPKRRRRDGAHLAVARDVAVRWILACCVLFRGIVFTKNY